MFFLFQIHVEKERSATASWDQAFKRKQPGQFYKNKIMHNDLNEKY